MLSTKTVPEFKDVEEVKLLDYVKKKRRWAFFWGALVSFLLFCIITAISRSDVGYPPMRDHIASVTIEGVITQDDYLNDMLDEISERPDVQAVIVNVNSPGGAVYPSEQIYERLRRIADHDVPIVAVMRDYAASGGYIASIAADHIIAGKTTMTGSIGVISEVPNISDVLDRIGIDTTLVRSSEAKGGISPLRDPTPEEIADEKAVIDGLYNWFKSLVGERRKLSGASLEAVSQGVVYTGEQALALGLIDEIGGDKAALDYLSEKDSKFADMELVDWEPLYPTSLASDYMVGTAQNLRNQLAKVAIEMQVKTYNFLMH